MYTAEAGSTWSCKHKEHTVSLVKQGIPAFAHLTATDEEEKEEEEEHLHVLWPVYKTDHMQQGINVLAQWH